LLQLVCKKIIPVRLAESWLKTLFWLNYYERKTMFRLKKQAEKYGL